MKNIINKLNQYFHRLNCFLSIIFFLCLSPILNFIFINIYYYNCGGNINKSYDVINLINPFNLQNPLCILVSTLMTSNIYIVQYINYILLLYIVSIIIY